MGLISEFCVDTETAEQMLPCLLRQEIVEEKVMML